MNILLVLSFNTKNLEFFFYVVHYYFDFTVLLNQTKLLNPHLDKTSKLAKRILITKKLNKSFLITYFALMFISTTNNVKKTIC